MPITIRYTGIREQPITAIERFASKFKVNLKTKCWEWQSKQNTGYGLFSVGDTGYQAHVTIYQLLVGDIPKGLELDHLCKVKHCVNPAHLEAVTHRENTIRRDTRKEVCARGHSLVEGNLYWARTSPLKTLKRQCRTCALASDKRRREERNAKYR